MISKIIEMHEKFLIHPIQVPAHLDKREKDFRVAAMLEELEEYRDATELVDELDALTDLIVFALGTVDRQGMSNIIDAAYERVMQANCEKELGSNDDKAVGRAGFEIDLRKPKGWVAPESDLNSLIRIATNKVKYDKKVWPAIKNLDNPLGRESIKVLDEAKALQIRKGEDYQNKKSRVTQADYYPRGITSIADVMHVKMTRIFSVMEAMEHGSTTNFESLEDSAIDLINYASFFVSYSRGKLEGQEFDRYDAFNSRRKV